MGILITFTSDSQETVAAAIDIADDIANMLPGNVAIQSEYNDDTGEGQFLIDIEYDEDREHYRRVIMKVLPFMVDNVEQSEVY